MEIRCGSCNKLFRVSDDKITGTGIKFKCTRCGEYVKITREAFEEYKLSHAAVAALDMFAPKTTTPPAPAGTAEHAPPSQKAAAARPSVKPSPKPEPHLAPEPVTELETEPVLSAAGPTTSEHAAPALSAAVEDLSALLSAEKAAPVEKSRHAQAAALKFVHPIASGASTGILGGLGCALPVLAFMLLGFGIAVKYVPFLSIMPVYHLAAVSAAGLAGFTIVISVFIAIVQAAAKKKIFFLLNILLGMFFGAALGAVQAVAVSLGTGAGINTVQIVSGAVGWGIASFFVGIAVVIVRAVMLSRKQEAFGVRLSGMQIFGVLLSLSIIGFAVYGGVMMGAQVQTAMEKSAAAMQDLTSPEGLQITNQSGALDANGDLIIKGTVENTADRDKPYWYVVVDVYDAQGNVLMQEKMLNGRQLYTPRDYEIMNKRGIDPQSLPQQEYVLPPGSTMNFEMRIMEPPAGVASFIASLQQYNAAKEMQKAMQGLAQPQPQAPQQPQH